MRPGIEQALVDSGDGLGLSDLCVLSVMRQHCVIAKHRPARALIVTEAAERPHAHHSAVQPHAGTSTSTVSAMQTQVLEYLVSQVPGMENAMIRWMAHFLELNRGHVQHQFLDHGRYLMCMLGAARDPNCLLSEIPMPLLCQILSTAGWRADQDVSDQVLSQTLQEHQHMHWLDPWHQSVDLVNFATVLSLWVRQHTGKLADWALNVALPCLLSQHDPEAAHGAVLITLGLLHEHDHLRTETLAMAPEFLLSSALRRSGHVRFHAELLENMLVQRIDSSKYQRHDQSPVSYTHLTLPTKRIV
eukprot:TRINITY_DN27496_c0_g1_i1.p1 TRINITY_DN27496_c0_g1~~TRINITY_DN27496_c0_g1_i1.p1  ORF type:complete len:302 (-),score=38.80 TRINITY_DN27496_c0_g1_i1:123-1028(-)